MKTVVHSDTSALYPPILYLQIKGSVLLSAAFHARGLDCSPTQYSEILCELLAIVVCSEDDSLLQPHLI